MRIKEAGIAKVLNIEEVGVTEEQGDTIAASAKNVVSENAFPFFLIFSGQTRTDKSNLEKTLKGSKAFFLLFCLLILIFVGCAHKKRQEVPPPLPAYLSFSGQTGNAKITVDADEFVLDESFLKTNRYQLSEGKHSVVVRHGEMVVVKRYFYLPGGVVKDIKIPSPEAVNNHKTN